MGKDWGSDCGGKSPSRRNKEHKDEDDDNKDNDNIHDDNDEVSPLGGVLDLLARLTTHSTLTSADVDDEEDVEDHHENNNYNNDHAADMTTSSTTTTTINNNGRTRTGHAVSAITREDTCGDSVGSDEGTVHKTKNCCCCCCC